MNCKLHDLRERYKVTCYECEDGYITDLKGLHCFPNSYLQKIQQGSQFTGEGCRRFQDCRDDMYSQFNVFCKECKENYSQGSFDNIKCNKIHIKDEKFDIPIIEATILEKDLKSDGNLNENFQNLQFDILDDLMFIKEQAIFNTVSTQNFLSIYVFYT